MLQEAFKNEVVKTLQRKLGESASIETVWVKKVNQDYEVIIIKMKGEDVVPTFSVPDYFQEFQEGKITLEGVADEMIGKLNHGEQIGVSYLASNIMNPEWVKANVQIKVINYEKNLEYLQKVPFEKFLDLALILYVAIPLRDGQGSITIQNHLLEQLGMGRDEIFTAAKQNMNHKKVVVRNIEDILFEFLANEELVDSGIERQIRTELGSTDSEKNISMIVVSNEEQLNGAQMLIKQGVLRQLANRLQSEKIFVMPSSIHELIGISAKGINPVQLQEMVQSINQTEVSGQNYLSDSVYLYDAEKDEVSIAA